MLLGRIDKLERDQISQRDYYEAKIGALEAENRADRHRMANIDQCFHTLVTMIQRNPNGAKEAAEIVLSLRADQEKSEATEKGAILGAKIIAPTLSSMASQENGNG